MSLNFIPLQSNLLYDLFSVILVRLDVKKTIIMPFYDFIVKLKNLGFGAISGPSWKRDEPYSDE